MPDVIYASIKASARKAGLLTDQQFTEFASQKDLKDLINRLKARYPELGAISVPSLKEFEGALMRSFMTEVDEFIKVCPDACKILTLIKREADEEDAASLLKWSLGLGDAPKLRDQPKKLTKEDAQSILQAKGFEAEAKEGTRLFKKYAIPGLIDSVFVKFRLLGIIKAVQRMGGAGEGIYDYVDLKVDLFNIITILRGIKNNVDPKAIEELLIFGVGKLGDEDLRKAVVSGNPQKALIYFGSISMPKAEGARDLEKAYEKMIASNLDRTYYNGFAEIGALIGYLELKLKEIIKLIRIANAVERSIDAKRAIQDYL